MARSVAVLGGASLVLAGLVLPGTATAAAPVPGKSTVTAVAGGTCGQPTQRINGAFYTVCEFTTNGTFTVTSTAANPHWEYVVVAGGGGGGGSASGGAGGGGGAGGATRTTTAVQFTPGIYDVTVGNGGPGGSAGGNNAGTNGGDSDLALQGGASVAHAAGGGGGGSGAAGLLGGSGGGGGAPTAINSTTAGGAGTTPQGLAGGTGARTTLGLGIKGGGGGGAGATGGNASNGFLTGGNGAGGGAGIAIAGLAGTVNLAGGGGGGGNDSGGGATQGGGLGGTAAGTAATASTGGGGGGAGATGGNGGNGGSGRVIVRVVTFPDNVSAVATTTWAGGATGNRPFSWTAPGYRPPALTGTGNGYRYTVLYRPTTEITWDTYAFTTTPAVSPPLSKNLSRTGCAQTGWTCPTGRTPLVNGTQYHFAVTGQVVTANQVTSTGQLNNSITPFPTTGTSASSIRLVTW